MPLATFAASRPPAHSDLNIMYTAPVLVIMNDPNGRALAVEGLEFLGFSVTEARTAGDGLRMVRQHLPCAIVLDLFNLADFDGVQLVRVLANHPATRDIPIIGVAASYNRDEVENVGLAALIGDPLELDELSCAVTAILGDPLHIAQRCG